MVPFTLTKAVRSGGRLAHPEGVGRRRVHPGLRGPKVKLRDAFGDANWISEFRRVDIPKPSGEVGHCGVATKDLVWGKDYCRALRFSVSRDLDTDATAVFVTDCPFLTGAQIVYIYLRCFSEEYSFKDVRDTLRSLENVPWPKRTPQAQIRG